VFNKETSACDQAENVPGCEDTYVKNKRFKNDHPASPPEESRSSGGHKVAAAASPDISSGEFSGFIALLKENGLLKPGALKALNAAMTGGGGDDDSKPAAAAAGLIHRDSRLSDGRSLGSGGAESEERTLVVGEEENDEDMEEEEGAAAAGGGGGENQPVADLVRAAGSAEGCSRRNLIDRRGRTSAEDKAEQCHRGGDRSGWCRGGRGRAGEEEEEEEAGGWREQQAGAAGGGDGEGDGGCAPGVRG